MLQFPTNMYRDTYKKFIGASRLSPTDSIIATIGNNGVMRYMGTKTRPPVALRHSHIAFHQAYRVRQHEGCGNDWLKNVNMQQQILQSDVHGEVG
jgi:hypothetical protein